MNKKFCKKFLTIILLFFITINNVLAIQDVNKTSSAKTKQKANKQTEEEITLRNIQKRVKKIRGKCHLPAYEIPQIHEFDTRPAKFSIMSIDECVKYAIEHRHDLALNDDYIRIAETGIGQARSNYAPRLFANVNYNHNTTKATRIGTNSENSMGFNVGISQTIWDFGRTTAKINMAKYNTLSAHYDYEYYLLDVIYNVKINYYKVLMALANLDIYEQNVRINTLNYDRTKSMFDEGLKSKIDVVNAEVNLADSKIQLVEGQNTLESSIIALADSMDYQEDAALLVKNTENFGFLKADYRKKMQNLNNIKPANVVMQKNSDGLIMLSSGIEHNDFVEGYEFKPLSIQKQEAVDKALNERPDLKAAKMVEKVQEESLKVLKKSYTPDLTANLTWGYTRNENDVYSSPLQFGAGIGIGTVNPYGIHYLIKEGEAYLDVARHNVNIALCDIFWEVQANYVNMRQLERQIPLMNTKVKATLENFELADGRYSVGLNNYVELQDALANYNTSQLNFVEAVFKYNVARETLLKSMGVK